MKEVEKRRALNSNRTRQNNGKTEKKDTKLSNNVKTPNGKDSQSKAPRAKPEGRTSVSDSNTGTETSEVYERVVVHYADDVDRSDEAYLKSKENADEVVDDSSSEFDKEVSDSETVKDSVSSSSHEDEKGEEKVSDGPAEKSGSDASDGAQIVGGSGDGDNDSDVERKVQEMEKRIERLEEELREVAALEISLYSVVPEHGSSAHKVHTPARRLSRIYIHACKYWGQERRASVTKNTVSGLLMVAKSCGNDVARLTFWLSNTVVLREIVSQAFGGLHHSSSITRLAESGGNSKQMNGFVQFGDDWHEIGTFTSALERVESWIFSRVVESVWWQALTPHMQSPSEVVSHNKNIRRLVGRSLGDQNQGNFSINLWKNGFQDAAQRLCPVRAGGHECGCLPALARLVMEQCIARLDIAMFNAILRESANEMPTDPVSDPIVDSKVLPISAGDLSFGSGVQLKNSIGNWSRWLTDMFGMDADDEDDERPSVVAKTKSFFLLNALSDLLMLPKDMLMDSSIRKEVCPSISLPLIKRILCNFTPDEFCPDPVAGAVLEALNAESIVEHRMSADSTRSFPYTVAPVVYTPPSPADVAEKCAVSNIGVRPELARNVSVVQRKGYTSDDELEELESPLMTIIDKLPSSPNIISNGNGKRYENAFFGSTNERYELLSEVWSV